MQQSSKRKTTPAPPMRRVLGCFAYLLMLAIGLGLGSGAVWLLVSDSFETQRALDRQANNLLETEQANATRASWLEQRATNMALLRQNMDSTFSAREARDSVLGLTATMAANQVAQQADQLATQNAENAATAQGVRLTATQIAQDAALTAAALDNARVQLGQTATQSNRNVAATRTRQAVDNVRQLTQVALDYAATQARLQQDATQVELVFRATQTAIAADGSNGSSLPARPTDASNPPTNTPSPSATAEAAPLPTLSAPAPTPMIWLDERFGEPAADMNADVWSFSDPLDWIRVGGNGLQSGHDGAWLLAQPIQRLIDPYRVEVLLRPAVANIADYALLHLTDTNGTAFVLHTNTLQVVESALYRFAPENLGPEGLPLGDLQQLDRNSSRATLTENARLVLESRPNSIMLYLNDVLLLESSAVQGLGPGRIGVQLPASADVQTLRITQID